MTISFSVLALIVAAVCFAIAAWWTPPRGNLIAAGLFFLTLSFLATSVKIAQG